MSAVVIACARSSRRCSSRRSTGLLFIAIAAPLAINLQDGDALRLAGVLDLGRVPRWQPATMAVRADPPRAMVWLMNRYARRRSPACARRSPTISARLCWSACPGGWRPGSGCQVARRHPGGAGAGHPGADHLNRALRAGAADRAARRGGGGVGGGGPGAWRGRRGTCWLIFAAGAGMATGWLVEPPAGSGGERAAAAMRARDPGGDGGWCRFGTDSICHSFLGLAVG